MWLSNVEKQSYTLDVEWTDFHPVLPIGVIGSCAADVYEPRQVREEAPVSGPLWVP